VRIGGEQQQEVTGTRLRPCRIVVKTAAGQALAPKTASHAACGVVVPVKGGRHWHSLSGPTAAPERRGSRGQDDAWAGRRTRDDESSATRRKQQGCGDSDRAGAAQPSVVGLVVGDTSVAGGVEDTARQYTAFTAVVLIQTQTHGLRLSHARSTLTRQRSVARCEPCASAHPKFTKPQSVKGRVPSYQIEKHARACWRRPGYMRGPEAGDLH